MKILFFGDSLTKGQVGAGFVRLLRKDYPQDNLVKMGTNGDTLNVITAKLTAHLKKVNDYDYIVLQGGGNDIMLPLFEARGGLFGFAYRSQVKKGMIPLLSPAAYYQGLQDMFSRVRQLYKGKIIFITLGCLSEKLDSTPNKIRRVYNKAGKKAAAEAGILLADIEPPFEQFLNDKTQTDYLINNFWAVTITDRIMCRFEKGISLLSKKRNLFLTVDGAHINNNGAAIIRELVRGIINEDKRNAGNLAVTATKPATKVRETKS